jgi:hypothetical protein
MGALFRIIGIWIISLIVWGTTLDDYDRSTYMFIYGLFSVFPGLCALVWMYTLEKWIIRGNAKWLALALGPAYFIVASLFEKDLKDLLVMYQFIGGLWTASSVWVVLRAKNNTVEN